MMFFIGYGLFVVLGIAVFIYTREVDEEFYDEAPVENLIGDAYTYRFVESDYDRVEAELLRFADQYADDNALAG